MFRARVILITFSLDYTFSKKGNLVLVNLSKTRLHFELTRLHFLPFHCISVEQCCIHAGFSVNWVFLNETKGSKKK